MSDLKFTDDDLKWLKEDLKTVYSPNEPFMQKKDIEALLARLEAETECVDLLKLHYESGTFDDLDEGDIALIVQALDARRKAAGK